MPRGKQKEGSRVVTIAETLGAMVTATRKVTVIGTTETETETGIATRTGIASGTRIATVAVTSRDGIAVAGAGVGAGVRVTIVREGKERGGVRGKEVQ